MRKLLASLVLLILTNNTHADNADPIGIELDALPWLTGGYYLSGWYAKNHFRYRAVLAKLNVPDAFVKDGFKDNEIKAYAMIVDYFPRRDLTGMWYGAGFEYWQNRISNKADGASAEYKNTVFTAGLGYVWRLSESIYLNPWGALHFVIGGDQDVAVGNKTYQQDSIAASASIKLGWQF